tara:strand:+ start:875 stop:1486 length:612 start_codon:yes stop_codon:yes gene_type:complete
MIISSKEILIENIYKKYLTSKKKKIIVSISGLSRSGKTTLSNEISSFLDKKSVCNEIMSLDSWIIDHRERKKNSTVLERYEMNNIDDSISKAVNGFLVKCPKYESESRRRIKHEYSKLIKIDKGVLIIEGVISLVKTSFYKFSDFKIFIEIKDSLRIKRLINFYRNKKKLNKIQYKKIILSREFEEKKIIINSKKNSNYILNL